MRRVQRQALSGSWDKLLLYRLGDEDLLLTKLMRDDPLDRRDAEFIVQRASFTRDDLSAIIQRAVLPDLPEIRDQFALACRYFI